MTGAERLAELFTAARLPVPPLPAGLAGGLVELSPWCFSTRPLSWSPYCFPEYVRELDTAPDYALVAHAGHGIASYALSVHAVCEGLACLLQVAWGGVYANLRLARWSLELLGGVLRGAEAQRAAGRLSRSRRLVVVASDFYGALPVTLGRDVAAPRLRTQPEGGDIVSGALAEALTLVNGLVNGEE